jgi:hypothetical protein
LTRAAQLDFQSGKFPLPRSFGDLNGSRSSQKFRSLGVVYIVRIARGKHGLPAGGKALVHCCTVVRRPNSFFIFPKQYKLDVMITIPVNHQPSDIFPAILLQFVSELKPSI